MLLRHAPTLALVLLLSAPTLGLTACFTEEEDGAGEGGLSVEDQALVDELTGALPTSANLEVDFPEVGTTEGGLADGTKAGAAVGELSNFYALTREHVQGMNLHLSRILAPVEWVIDRVQPTIAAKGKAIWFGSDADEPQEWLLVVERLDGQYDWVLALRDHGGGDEDWVALMAGQYWPSGVEDVGEGWVWLDLEQDDDADSTGKLGFAWSNDSFPHYVTAYLFGVSGDDATDPGNAVFHHERNEDDSGLFLFVLEGVDIDDGEEGKEALEDAYYISRWTEDGDGRADVAVTEGDVALDGYEAAVLTQCWEGGAFQTTFEAVHLKEVGDDHVLAMSDGDFETCAYDNIAQAELPPLGEEPGDAEVPEQDP